MQVGLHIIPTRCAVCLDDQVHIKWDEVLTNIVPTIPPITETQASGRGVSAQHTAQITHSAIDCTRPKRGTAVTLTAEALRVSYVLSIAIGCQSAGGLHWIKIVIAAVWKSAGHVLLVRLSVEILYIEQWIAIDRRTSTRRNVEWLF